MPRGVPNKPKAEAAAAQAVNAVVQDTAAAGLKVVRSREEQTAQQYADEFLKNNRIDFSSFEKKLAFYGEKPGWVRRWVLDQGSRMQTLMARGWRVVPKAEALMSDSVGRGNTDIGDQVSVVTTAGDGPVRQVLMEIPQVLYDMYTKARTEPARATEEAIRKGAFKIDDDPHVYTPGERPTSHHYGLRNTIESKRA